MKNLNKQIRSMVIMYCIINLSSFAQVDAKGERWLYGLKDTFELEFDYYGQVENKVPHGNGKAYFKNGRIYTGEFAQGKRQGNGIYEYTNGDSYDGGWKNDKRNGKGTYNWVDGRKYVGDWLNHARTGKGVYERIDGSFYEGLWNENELYKGTYSYPNGIIFTGYFKNDKWHKGSVIYKNLGTKLQGYFKNNKLNGYGTYKNKYKQYFDGVWSDNKLKGKDLNELDKTTINVNKINFSNNYEALNKNFIRHFDLYREYDSTKEKWTETKDVDVTLIVNNDEKEILFFDTGGKLEVYKIKSIKSKKSNSNIDITVFEIDNDEQIWILELYNDPGFGLRIIYNNLFANKPQYLDSRQFPK